MKENLESKLRLMQQLSKNIPLSRQEIAEIGPNETVITGPFSQPVVHTFKHNNRENAISEQKGYRPPAHIVKRSGHFKALIAKHYPKGLEQ